MTQRTVSIGYRRSDGDFRILATLNNIDEELDQHEFNNILVHNAFQALQALLPDYEIEILERQDAPDYVDLEEEEHELASLEWAKPGSEPELMRKFGIKESDI